MKKTVLIMLLGLALLLAACGLATRGDTAQPPSAYGVYFSALGSSRAVAAVDCEYRQLPDGTSPVPALMELLLQGPEQAGLRSPFPKSGVRLLSWRLQDGQLRLNLSEQYGELSGVALTMADYCIALTLCQVEGVDSVYITVAGEELPFRHSQQLRAEDVILSGAEEEPVYMGVNIWFPRAGEDSLGVEYRQVTKTEDTPLLEAVLQAWLAGPEFEGLQSELPGGTVLRGITLEEGLCTVNLSQQFAVAPGNPVRARLLLYSLVNTLGGLEPVEAVQLHIEGIPLVTYGGARADGPLKTNPQLEKRLTKP